MAMDFVGFGRWHIFKSVLMFFTLVLLMGVVVWKPRTSPYPRSLSQEAWLKQHLKSFSSFDQLEQVPRQATQYAQHGPTTVEPSQINTSPHIMAKDSMVHFQTYAQALESRASPEKIIILSYVDLGVKTMALNFYITSLHPYNISNYLFLSSNEELCQLFHSMDIPCFLYTNDTASDVQSLYQSKDFLRKMNIRTFMIVDALQLGYNVLHTDVDMYFFRNPLPRVLTLCRGTCHVAPLWDCGADNAGFLYIANSKISLHVYLRMKHLAQNTKMDDQKALNQALREERGRGLKLSRLPQSEFHCGMSFFEVGHRTFAGDHPCTTCQVVHNNWIVSTEAKVYRFKEMHMWMYDGQGYYSDPTRKYLTYENHAFLDKWQDQKGALINALAIGRILNRTVILPKFLCGNGKTNCTLLNYVKLIHFDMYFGDKYRESTFLSHPLVPGAVKNSVSNVLMIQSAVTKKHFTKQNEQIFQPRNTEAGATSQEIQEWFLHREELVLKFHSLYNSFANFTDKQDYSQFSLLCKTAFHTSRSRQF